LKLCRERDFPEHAGRAMLIDPSEVSSVPECVEQLNNGERLCEAGMCIVYSSACEAYYLLYERRKANQAHTDFFDDEAKKRVKFLPT